MTESLSRQCKCHGVSGSCSMRTCFKSLPFDMRPVAQQLRNRYSVAVHVDPRTAVRQRATSRSTERTSRRRRGHRRTDTSDSNNEGLCKSPLSSTCLDSWDRRGVSAGGHPGMPHKYSVLLTSRKVLFLDDPQRPILKDQFASPCPCPWTRKLWKLSRTSHTANSPLYVISWSL